MSDQPYNSRRLLNRTGASVAIGLVTLFGLAITLLYFFDIPKDNLNVLLVLLGNLAACVTAITQWFFGGSLAGTRKQPDQPALAPGTATMTATASIAAPEPNETKEQP